MLFTDKNNTVYARELLRNINLCQFAYQQLQLLLEDVVSRHPNNEEIRYDCQGHLSHSERLFYGNSVQFKLYRLDSC